MGHESWPKTKIECAGGGPEGSTEDTASSGIISAFRVISPFLQLGKPGHVPPSAISKRRCLMDPLWLGLGDLHLCVSERVGWLLLEVLTSLP